MEQWEDLCANTSSGYENNGKRSGKVFVGTIFVHESDSGGTRDISGRR